MHQPVIAVNTQNQNPLNGRSDGRPYPLATPCVLSFALLAFELPTDKDPFRLGLKLRQPLAKRQRPCPAEWWGFEGFSMSVAGFDCGDGSSDEPPMSGRGPDRPTTRLALATARMAGTHRGATT